MFKMIVTFVFLIILSQPYSFAEEYQSAQDIHEIVNDLYGSWNSVVSGCKGDLRPSYFSQAPSVSITTILEIGPSKFQDIQKMAAFEPTTTGAPIQCIDLRNNTIRRAKKISDTEYEIEIRHTSIDYIDGELYNCVPKSKSEQVPRNYSYSIKRLSPDSIRVEYMTGSCKKNQPYVHIYNRLPDLPVSIDPKINCVFSSRDLYGLEGNDREFSLHLSKLKSKVLILGIYKIELTASQEFPSQTPTSMRLKIQDTSTEEVVYNSFWQGEVLKFRNQPRSHSFTGIQIINEYPSGKELSFSCRIEQGKDR